MNKTKWWILGSCIFFSLVCAIIFGITTISKALTDVEFPLLKPIAKIDFDDGTVLRILQVGETSLVDAASKKPSIGNNSGSTSSYAQIDVSDNLINGVLSELRFEGEANDLIIELQLSDARGEPLLSRGYADHGLIQSPLGTGSNSYYQNIDEFTSSKPTTPGIEFILQLQDPSGGWTTANGPLGSDKDELHRAAVTFSGWSRDQKMFTFRALRQGCKPYRFSLPNPYYVPMAKAWTTKPYPHVYKSPDCTFKLSKIEEVIIPNHGRILKPSIEFTTRFPKTARVWGEEEISYELEHCKDPTGGLHHETAKWTAKNQAKYGISFPSHAKQAVLTYSIERHCSFPKPKTDAVIIAEATVSADGKQLTIDKINKIHGITHIRADPLKVDYKKELFPIHIQGEWNTKADRASAESTFLGEIRNAHLVIYKPSDTHSTGYSRKNSSGISSSFNKSEFHMSVALYGDFVPDQKILLALCAPTPPEKITFTVDLPTSQTKKKTAVGSP